MIDTLTIILTCAACIYIAFQAVRLDSLLPWFGPPTRQQDPAPAPAEAPPPGRTPTQSGWRSRATPPER